MIKFIQLQLKAYLFHPSLLLKPCKNHKGQNIFVISAKSGLQLDTMDEQRLQKIRDLENYQRPEKVEVEPVGQKPVFITPLNRSVKMFCVEHVVLWLEKIENKCIEIL